MRTRKVNLTGPLPTAPRPAAPRTWEREEQQHEATLAALRAAIDEGDISGIAGGDVFARVRKKLKLPRPGR